MNRLFKILTVTFTLLITYAMSYSQKVDCNKPNNVIATNQKIREKTYQYVQLVTDKNRKVNQDTLTALAVDYIDIQTSFNEIFTSMKEDRGNFASKQLICNRYSERLTVLIAQATNYDNRILHIISPKTKVNNFGPSDVMDIIDWLFKKFSEGNTKFYDKVKWRDWKEIADGTVKPDETKPKEETKPKKDSTGRGNK
jgi:hypothetical protein